MVLGQGFFTWKYEGKGFRKVVLKGCGLTSGSSFIRDSSVLFKQEQLPYPIPCCAVRGAGLISYSRVDRVVDLDAGALG